MVGKGPLKGNRVELAPATGVESLQMVANEFMREIFGLEPGAYLITDLSSLYDFVGIDRMQSAGMLARVKQVYGLDLTDLPDGNLLEIFNRVREQQRGRRRHAQVH